MSFDSLRPSVAGLADFLFARYAEDAVALGHWTPARQAVSDEAAVWRVGVTADGIVVHRSRLGGEVAAKRTLVKHGAAMLSGSDGGPADETLVSLHFVMRALAVGYRNHPDYRDQWLP